MQLEKHINDASSVFKVIIKMAEEVSEKKKMETGKKDGRLEQALEILKLHQPLVTE